MGIKANCRHIPELLDFLANEFVTTPARGGGRSASGLGWSLKALHRLIVTSATYRQSSQITPTHLKRDPENRLLRSQSTCASRCRRSPRRRHLTVSGLLSPKIGGASVFPPQPPGITSEGTYGPLAWNVSVGEDKYRRGLYTFSKRTAPYAMFTTFDAPSGEATCPRREVSNTPLQALTLLNDQVFHRSGASVGQRNDGRTGNHRRQSTPIVCTMPGSHTPTQKELSAITEFYEKQRQRVEKKELDAQALTK